ncbi:MAG: VanZ family protein [Bacteroidota bacterium]
MNIKSTRRWIFVAFAWVAVIYVGTSSPLMAGTVTRALFGNYDGMIRSLGHMCEFFILTFILYGIIATRRLYGWKGVALVLFIVAVVAFLDEYHQLFVPGRSYKNVDIVKDMIGACSAIVAAKIPQIRRKIFNEKPRYRRVAYYV